MDYIYDFRVQHLFLMLFVFTMVTVVVETLPKKNMLLSQVLMLFGLCVVMVGVIFYIQAQVPYYLEMG